MELNTTVPVEESNPDNGGEMVAPGSPICWFSNIDISCPEAKGTKEIMDKFDDCLDEIKHYVSESKTVREGGEKISTYLNGLDLSTCGSFDTIFYELQITLQWYDVEALDDICEKLELSEIEKLTQHRKQYKTDLEQYFNSRENTTFTTLSRECRYQIRTDDAWDHKELLNPQKCKKTCEKIMRFLGKCTKETAVQGNYDGSRLNITL